MLHRLNLTRLIAFPLVFAVLLRCAWLLGGISLAGDGVNSATPQSLAPNFDRVFINVLENTDFDRAMEAPFLRHLTTLGVLFTNFHAIAHPSYPNYLAMATGSSLNVRNDTQQDLDITSLVDPMEAAGVSWKVYAENLPSPCFRGTVSPDGLYVRRHEPYISVRNIQTNPDRCARIVNAAQLSTDVADDAVPQYGLYVPNVRHDGHDTGIQNADTWLQGFLTPLLATPQFMRRTLLVVTFDEGSRVWGNRIYTAFVGEGIPPGITNGTPYNHYSLLRLIENNYGIGTLGREDAKATAICCVWKR